MATALVIAISSVSGSASGTDVENSGVTPLRSLPVATVTPEKCPGVLKALRWYTKRWQHWTSLRTGAAVGGASVHGLRRGCPRYLLKVRQAKALAAHKAWNHYFWFHYAWSDWMPEKWQRIGACETGYGKRPGDFHWNSGTYQGFAGFWYGTWDAYKPKGAPSEAYLATPRQQYQCALNVAAVHGYGAWGCGGA